jgi:hypothetical protein
MAISNDGMSSSESVGFFSQFGDSVKGILTGFALIPLSIFLIFKVETCTQAGDAFKNAKPVTQMEEGKPVYKKYTHGMKKKELKAREATRRR